MNGFALKIFLFYCRCIVGAVAALGSVSTWAACNFLAGDINTPQVTFNVPTVITVPRNTPNGAEIYRVEATPNGQPLFNCRAGDALRYTNSRGAWSDDGPSPIYTTGIGWRFVSNGVLIGDTAIPRTTRYTMNGNPVEIRLYKVGDVTPGLISRGLLGTFVIGGLNVLHLNFSNAIRLTEVSCETPSVNVDLGRQRSSQFGAVGTTVGQKDFNIQLNNCPAGLDGISYRLDPVNTAFNATLGVLSLDEGGATGVGIQISNASGNAVSLGEEHRLLSSAPSGNYTIPLKAAYYKTATTVQSGKANASMQFTITYQ